MSNGDPENNDNEEPQEQPQQSQTPNTEDHPSKDVDTLLDYLREGHNPNKERR
jgi:hypothetical protein